MMVISPNQSTVNEPFHPFESETEAQGAHLKRRSSPGTANAVQTRKNPSHPRCFARNPVGAEANARVTPIRQLRSAYWVAVYFLFVILAI